MWGFSAVFFNYSISARRRWPGGLFKLLLLEWDSPQVGWPRFRAVLFGGPASLGAPRPARGVHIAVPA
jgi:hypothetical protein